MLKHKLKLNWNILFFTEKHIPKILYSRSYLTFKRKTTIGLHNLILLSPFLDNPKIKDQVCYNRKT